MRRATRESTDSSGRPDRESTMPVITRKTTPVMARSRMKPMLPIRIITGRIANLSR